MPAGAEHHLHTFTDATDPNKSGYWYLLSGTDTVCNNSNDIFKIIKGATLRAVPKAGGATITLETAPFGGRVVFSPNHTAGDRAYYSVQSGGASPTVTAKVVKEDGTVEPSISNSEWKGLSFDTTQTTANSEIPPLRIFRVENMTGTSTASSTLTSVDALTNSGVISHGTIPDDIITIDEFFGFGNNLLGRGFNASGNGDIFFVNATLPNSIMRITNTPGIDEE